MDYKKKYEQALAKAKNMIDDLRKGEDILAVSELETMFPELVESDDERIRKELIKHLREGAEGYEPTGNTEDYTRWLSWVEKQKEYESTDFEYVWDRTDCGALTSALDKYSEEAIINMCHAWYDKGIELERKSWLEKQGCQKSVDKKYTFKSIPRLLDMIEPTDRAKSYCKKLIDSLQTEGYSVDAKIVGKCLKQMNGEKVAMAVMDTEKQDEQKPQRMVSAEAKEALYDKPTDEEMKELLRTEYEKGRADTIAEMYVPTQISPEESLGVSSEKYMDIVDTLTQGGQKPAKWSLEDERVIAIINNALTESNTPPDDYDKVYDWLESIKQRM